MPLVRIDLLRHFTDSQVEEISGAIHESFCDVFSIPLRDKFHIITRHESVEIKAEDAGLGFERDENVVLIQITTQRGRSQHRKLSLYQSITKNLLACGVSENNVFISYVENSAEDWSFGFGKAQFVQGELTPYGS